MRGLIIFLLCLISVNLYAANKIDNYAKISLIKGEYINNNILLGVYFQLQEGWKIYDNSEQNLGFPTKIIPLKNEAILDYKAYFPKPISFQEFEQFTSTGYKDKVIFPLMLQTNNKAVIDGEILVEFALCKNICLRFEEKLKFNIKENEFNKNNLKLINSAYKQQASHNYFYIIIIAIIAGFILNLMPCVLPIILLKIYNLLDKEKYSKKEVCMVSIATILGIFCSFLIFMILAIILKSVGASLGWAMHFQEPIFIALLALALSFFCCNIFDVFTFNLPYFLTDKLDNLIRKKKDFFKHFITGILATIMATPCSAPFLGTAIGFALTGSIIDIAIIFISMAIGLSLPYILLIIKPNLLNFFPKSGPWLKYLKNLMGVFLVFTIIWLLYILYKQTDFITILLFVLTLKLLVLFLKYRINFVKISNILIYRSLFFVMLIFSILVVFIAKKNNQTEYHDDFWLAYNQYELNKLIEDQYVIFVNVTADWCITCKFNEIRVFKRKKFREYIKNNKILAIKADYTNSNKDTELLLNSVGRFAVPTYIIFSKANPQGKVLSEIITLDQIKKELDYEINIFAP